MLQQQNKFKFVLLAGPVPAKAHREAGSVPEGRAVRPHNSKQMQRICLESLSFYDRLRTRVREYRTRVLLIYGMKWCHGRREKEKRLRSQDMERPI